MLDHRNGYQVTRVEARRQPSREIVTHRLYELPALLLLQNVINPRSCRRGALPSSPCGLRRGKMPVARRRLGEGGTARRPNHDPRLVLDRSSLVTGHSSLPNRHSSLVTILAYHHAKPGKPGEQKLAKSAKGGPASRKAHQHRTRRARCRASRVKPKPRSVPHSWPLVTRHWSLVTTPRCEGHQQSAD